MVGGGIELIGAVVDEFAEDDDTPGVEELGSWPLLVIVPPLVLVAAPHPANPSERANITNDTAPITDTDIAERLTVSPRSLTPKTRRTPESFPRRTRVQ
jgi:hypothetical protein